MNAVRRKQRRCSVYMREGRASPSFLLSTWLDAFDADDGRLNKRLVCHRFGVVGRLFNRAHVAAGKAAALWALGPGDERRDLGQTSRRGAP